MHTRELRDKKILEETYQNAQQEKEKQAQARMANERQIERLEKLNIETTQRADELEQKYNELLFKLNNSEIATNDYKNDVHTHKNETSSSSTIKQTGGQKLIPSGIFFDSRKENAILSDTDKQKRLGKNGCSRS